MRLGETIVRSAEAGLAMVDGATGTMPAGHNGWVGDPETPVRNTGHWSIIFFKAYALSGEIRFRDAGLATAEWLLSVSARPMGATFWHRFNPDKDSCNGVIGSGFTIGALTAAYAATGDDRFQNLAEEVFRLHPFDPARRIWRRVNVDGSRPRGLLYGFDLTLNHQLWLSMAGSLVDPDCRTDIGGDVNTFLDGLADTRNLTVARDGRIIDEIFPVSTVGDLALTSLRHVHRQISVRHRGNMVRKELNYQAYSLFTLARIAENYPNHRLWGYRKFLRALHLIGTNGFLERIKSDRPRFWNRATGFELAKALEVFHDRLQVSPVVSAEQWVAMEIEYHFDFKANLLTKNAVDTANQAANLFEATYLGDMEIEPTALSCMDTPR